MTAPFPGEVFDYDGSSVPPGKPDIGQYALNLVPAHSLVTATEVIERPGPFELNAGRIWLLNGGTRLDAIPAAERYTARAILREGQGILILALDKETEMNIRDGLLSWIEADATGRGYFGHA